MGRRSRNVVALATVALATALAGGLTAAYASHIVKIASHISIHDKGLKFSGRVTASNPGCEDARKVTLHRTNGQILGHATTNSTGHWKITVTGSAGISLGHFFATVKRESQGAAGTIYVCKRARSRTIPFHQ